MNIEIVENALPQQYNKELYEMFTAADFPWHFADNTVGVQDNMGDFILTKDSRESPLFSHGMWVEGSPRSQYFQFIRPITYFVQESLGRKLELVRIKANLQLGVPNFKEGAYNPPHLDSTVNGYISAIYYVNDSSGDTVFFEEYGPSRAKELTETLRVKPKANNLAIFDSNRFHASSPPRGAKPRININFMFR